MAIRQRFVFSEERGKYRDLRTGRFVSPLEVRRAIDATIRQDQQRARNLAADFRAGRISLERFRLEMRALQREVNIYAAVTARGGINRMDLAAWGQVGGVVAEQDRFLEGFIADIESGKQRLTASLENRAAMYVQAGRETHERARRDVEVEGGATEVRNVLRDAAHCQQCPELTHQGWQPISASIPPPGSRECGPNCRCILEYR